MSRVTLVLAVLLGTAAGLAVPAHAAKRCPLDVATCLEAYGKMRERPWLGVDIDTDSTGAERIVEVLDGGPADRAGIKTGDILQSVDGQAPLDWFAGRNGWSRNGWKENDRVALTVVRGNKERRLALELHRIPEETLARIIGVHMIESHLAYANEPMPDRH